jgi:hypothetical protein
MSGKRRRREQEESYETVIKWIGKRRRKRLMISSKRGLERQKGESGKREKQLETRGLVKEIRK